MSRGYLARIDEGGKINVVPWGNNEGKREAEMKGVYEKKSAWTEASGRWA